MKNLNLTELFIFINLLKLSFNYDYVDDNLSTLEIKTENRTLYFDFILSNKNKIKIYYIIYDETSENHVFLKLNNINEIIYMLRNLNQ